MKTVYYFHYMADIIRKEVDAEKQRSPGAKSSVIIADAFMEDFKKNIENRLEVTKWFRSHERKKGSPLEKDNEQHEHFNKEIAKVFPSLRGLEGALRIVLLTSPKPTRGVRAVGHEKTEPVALRTAAP